MSSQTWRRAGQDLPDALIKQVAYLDRCNLATMSNSARAAFQHEQSEAFRRHAAYFTSSFASLIGQDIDLYLPITNTFSPIMRPRGPLCYYDILASDMLESLVDAPLPQASRNKRGHHVVFEVALVGCYEEKSEEGHLAPHLLMSLHCYSPEAVAILSVAAGSSGPRLHDACRCASWSRVFTAVEAGGIQKREAVNPPNALQAIGQGVSFFLKTSDHATSPGYHPGILTFGLAIDSSGNNEALTKATYCVLSLLHGVATGLRALP